MEHALSRMVAAALVWGMLVLPGALSAGERRGANILLALKDGHTLAGELIAVKPESLILISPTGKDESVGLADIAVITIVRKSKAWQGFLIGFVPAAVGGAIWGHHMADDDMGDRAAIAYGMIFGALPGLIGLAIGAGAGLDTEIAFAGLPDEERDRVLARLDGQARKPGVWLPKPGTPAAGAKAKGRPAALPWR